MLVIVTLLLALQFNSAPLLRDVTTRSFQSWMKMLNYRLNKLFHLHESFKTSCLTWLVIGDLWGGLRILGVIITRSEARN